MPAHRSPQSRPQQRFRLLPGPGCQHVDRRLPPPRAAKCWPAAAGPDRHAVTMTHLARRMCATRAPSPGSPVPQRGPGEFTSDPATKEVES